MLRRLSVLAATSLLAACPQQQATRSDSYPGDRAYTEKVQRLLRDVRNDRMNFPWAGRSGITRKALCEELVRRHFNGAVDSGDPNTPPKTNAQFLACPDVDEATLKQACEDALAHPRGFGSPDGWNAWRGDHDGRWQQDGGPASDDDAHWSDSRKETSKVPGDTNPDGTPRVYDFQEVRWANRRGWNQSHPDVPYVWGWDPKNNGDENGEIGTHLGFPFSLPPCQFILWITPKEAFLEGINPNADGRPKTSTGFGGRGQWNVRR